MSSTTIGLNQNGFFGPKSTMGNGFYKLATSDYEVQRASPRRDITVCSLGVIVQDGSSDQNPKLASELPTIRRLIPQSLELN